ncbi:MAG TPA: GvpL/GvpF family gas vesicle protein [Trebonia sp.]|nr:GvpL/GvpF family gas vesicle protein [Trebonia sp.]
MTPESETAVYIYGILPGDVAFQEQPAGLGHPPAPVRLVPYRDIAALVSDVDQSAPLDSPDDLLVHQQLLDASAAAVPVLPVAFGAVVADEDAVVTELLEPSYEEFSAALAELDGFQEYIVRGRYVREAILSEILTEDPEAAALSAQTFDGDPAASHDGQVHLRELISERLADKRALDSRQLGDALASQASTSAVRAPADELEAVHTAFLVKATDVDQMVEAARELAAGWAGRIELRIVGPVAAYDFVGTTGTSLGLGS